MKAVIEGYMPVYGMIGLGIAGLILKIMVSCVYNHLIHASDKMGNSSNKLMKLIRLKFETCYQLRIGVHNVESFVDKYMYRYRIMGVLLTTWENLSAQILILSMLYGTAMVVSAIISKVPQDVLFVHFFAAISVCAILVLLDSINNLSVKRRRLQNNIIDYLDNYLKIRLENEMMMQADDGEALEEKNDGEEQIAAAAEKSFESILDRTMDEGMEELLNSLLETADAKKSSAREKERQENAVIAEVLGEYFV